MQGAGCGPAPTGFVQLDRYIRYLLPRAFATHVADGGVPFSFLVGNRGAMAGIGVSIGIALAYWGLSTLFEKIGDVNQLPPSLAAWSPDVVFSLAGLYMLLRLRS